VATYNLRRFSKPDILKTISPEHLSAFLSHHRDFLSTRGFDLPSSIDPATFDYDGLVDIFMEPDVDTPKDLSEALFFVDEMATPDGMDILQEEAEARGMTITGSPDPTPADVAVQVWLQDKDVLEQKHAERFIVRRRSFEYYRTEASPIPAFSPPSPEALKALEKDVDDWFEKKKRGRGARVFVYPKGGETWFLVRHGEPYKREGSIEKGEPSSIFYRPEKFDVLAYDASTGEIRVNAASKGEKDLYRRQFGRHVFGSDDFFSGAREYTLEPLRTDGEASLVCTDVDGMDWAKLKEVQYYWGGACHETEVRKADDIFAALKDSEREMPTKARIIRANFQVKFTDSKTPRTVVIRAGNTAQYTRDADSVIIEKWLTLRHFIK